MILTVVPAVHINMILCKIAKGRLAPATAQKKSAPTIFYKTASPTTASSSRGATSKRFSSATLSQSSKPAQKGR